MAIAWPVGVPTKIALSYAAQPQNGRVEFETDIGPALKRRGTTLDIDRATLTFTVWTKAEFALFRSWYADEAKQGVEDFIFPDPISGVSSVWSFEDTYRVQGITNELVQVTISALKLRAA